MANFARMTNAQRQYRGLDASRRPGDAAQIAAALAELRALKAMQGEPLSDEPRDRRIYKHPRW